VPARQPGCFPERVLPVRFGAEEGHTADFRKSLLEKLDPFAFDLRAGGTGNACNVSTWAREAGDKPILNRVIDKDHDDGDHARHLLRTLRHAIPVDHKDVHLKTDQPLQNLLKAFEFPLG
jgi:hypothetical protein